MKRLRHPIRAIEEPFGKAGLIVAVLALVLALTGAAFAATGLNGKQKKEVEKIAKKFAGKPGAPGTNGSPGAKGDAGSPGTNGTNGESVTQAAATSAECNGVAGGVKYTLAGVTTKICNGKNGTTGFTEVLPPGKTETGTWGIGPSPEVGHNSHNATAISFPIPLAAAIEVSKVHIFEGAVAPTGCTLEGSFLKAAAGNLCVEDDGSLGLGANLKASQIIPFNLELQEEGVGQTGLILAAPGIAEGTAGFGTWAVTAEE